MVFFIVYCFLSLSGVTGDDCQNPLFDDPIRLFGRKRIQMELLSSPQIQPNFGSCQHLDGHPSCCNAITFQPFVSYYKSYDAQMDLAVQVIKTQSPAQIELLLESWNSQWRVNDIQRGYLIDLISRLQPLIDSFVKCNGGLLGYRQGMLCFGCHPDWANYYDQPNNLLYLTTDTCNSVVNQCNDMLTQLNQIALPILADIIGVANNTATPNAALVAELSFYRSAVAATGAMWVPLGFTSIKDLICRGYLHGLVASLNLQPPGPNQLLSHSIRSSHPAQDIPELQSLWTLLEPMDIITSHLSSSHPNRKLQQAPPGNNYVFNSYGNGTSQYDAYAAGCECELSVHACPLSPAASNQNRALIIGVSVASVIVLTIILFAVIYFLKKRNPQTDAHVPLEEEYEAPSNQRQLIEEGLRGATTPDSSNTGETSAYIAPSPHVGSTPSTQGSINS